MWPAAGHPPSPCWRCCGSSPSSGRCISAWTMTLPVMLPVSAWGSCWRSVVSLRSGSYRSKRTGTTISRQNRKTKWKGASYAKPSADNVGHDQKLQHRDIPIGFFPALLFRNATLKRSAIIGFGMSTFIEFAQYFIMRNTAVDDIILNTLGAICGYWVYRLLRKMFPSFSRKFICNITQAAGN